MGDPIPITFGSSSHPGIYGPDTGPRHINVRSGSVPEGKNPQPYYSYWGYGLFSQVPGGLGCRGLLPIGNILFAITGQEFSAIDGQGYGVVIGGIPGSSQAIMARNARTPSPQIAIIADGVKYIYSGGALATLSDPDLPSPNSVTFLNQRLIYGIPDGRLFWSSLTDGSDIDALDFATAEGNPDGLVRVFEHRLDLWVFGEKTTEIWRDTGQNVNTFLRVSGGYIQHGCLAPHSVAAIEQKLMWVNHLGQVVVALGYEPQVVSHDAIQRSVASVSDKSLITGAAYAFQGIQFYELSGPDWTWVLNLSTGNWFEARSFGQSRRRTQCVANFAGKIVFGDTTNGNLYALSATTFTENGTEMEWILQSSPMHAYPNRISVYRLYADFVTGLGLNSTNPDACNPTVQLDWSDDGGRAWSNIRHQTLGKIGMNADHVEFNALGTTGRQGRIWRLRVSSPVPRAMMGAAIEGNKIGT